MKCPILRMEGDSGWECLKEKCEWWLQAEGGGCAMVWLVVWLERISSRIGA
jgi:hypothetical protein